VLVVTEELLKCGEYSLLGFIPYAVDRDIFGVRIVETYSVTFALIALGKWST
jgi:hypothetical protein